MPPKRPDDTKQASNASTEENAKHVVVPSKIIGHPVDLENTDETEIAAQITLPQDGGWGWVVVGGSFICIFLVDGVSFTFGSIFGAITEDLKVDVSLISLVNSIAVALYSACGPFASALTNRFGFRAVTMIGSIITAFALFCSHYAHNYTTFCIFYGVIAGVGYCFVNLPACLVVGFYFERLRALALALATCGSSFGVMVMSPLNSYIIQISGWRTLTLLHSGLFGACYFVGMVFRPLVSLTVTQTTDDPQRTVTYLPSLIKQKVKAVPSRQGDSNVIATPTEKLFSAVSNVHFPTAAAVVHEDLVPNTTQTGVAGPSIRSVSRLTLTAHAPKGMSQRQLNQVKSILSRSNVNEASAKSPEIIIKAEEPKEKPGCCPRFCRWESHVQQSRPMYRDDVFYNGKIETLPVYKKSVLDVAADQKTGLEYQLAVSRAATLVDLEEKKGVCTTAARRILATMMDPELLRKRSFKLVCLSAFLVFLGTLVPFMFVQDRNRHAGIAEEHCTWFVSVIGFSNLCGRLTMGMLACKMNPVKLFVGCTLTAGVVTAVSNFSSNVLFQYIFCFIYGFSICCVTSLRSMALVELFGLEKLTNATGIIFLFQGISTCISTPLASFVESKFGYTYSFYLAGLFIFLAGVCLVPVQALVKKENKAKNDAHKNFIGPQNQMSPVPVSVKKHSK